MRADIVPGAVFPNYELTDHTTKRRSLADLQGPDPMVVVLSRGGYCPKDRRQAEGLLQLYHEMDVGYCRLVTISTDNLMATNDIWHGKTKSQLKGGVKGSVIRLSSVRDLFQSYHVA